MHELTGQALFSLLLGSKGWIHRRVVVVDFAEAGQLRQEVILDFTLPRDIVGRVEAGQVAVPLALMVKGARIGFDVTGPGGQAVPILNTSQQAGPVTALLDHAFRWAWPGERLDESMRAAIDSMVTAVTFAESRIHMRKVLDSLPPGPHGQGRSRERATFEALMRSLAHNYLLLGVLPTGVVGQRSVLRYAFLSYPPPPPRQWKTPYVEYGIPVADPGFSESLHLEVRVPDELEIVTLRDVRAPTADAEGLQPAGVRLAHERMGDAGRFGGGGAVVVVQPASGPMKSFSLSMLFIVTAIVVLAVVEMWVPGHVLVADTTLPSPGASVLLGLPALILSWMARRPENVLMRQTLSGVRWVNILGAAALYLMACLAAVPVVTPVWAMAWSLVGALVVLQWLQWSFRVRATGRSRRGR